jgi:hypothetical protein
MYLDEFVLADNYKRRLVRWSGITELITFTDEQEKTKGWNKPPNLKDVWVNGSFGDTASVRRSQLVINKAQAFQDALMASDAYRMAAEKAKTTKRRRVFELDGGELDIDRYMGQQDECWVRVTRGLQRPVVRICVQLSASSGNDESSFAGVAALGTCCALLAEQAGCSLEILITMLLTTIENNGVRETGSVYCVKQADEPFNQLALLACGTPALFRYYQRGIDINVLKNGQIWYEPSVAPITALLREHLQVQHVLELAWRADKQQMFLDDFVKTLHDA